MSNWSRFWIGGLGGLAPALLFLITGDLVGHLTKLDTFLGLGYAARGIGLFLVGGLIAYFHTDETKPFKVFEIGIAAPALLAGAVTTSQLAPPRAEYVPASAFAVVATAYAQSPGKAVGAGVKTYSPPQQGRWGEFIEGLAGITPRNVWYVRVGSAATAGDARQLAANVEQRLPKSDAEVFRSDDGRGYDVVIGRQLEKSQAQALRDRAVRAGLAETEAFIPRSLQYGR